MKRWLAIYNDDNGQVRSAMVSVPEEQEDNFPFGVAANTDLTDRLNDYNRGGGLALVEMPDETFRPVVVNVDDDEEASMQFIDL